MTPEERIAALDAKIDALRVQRHRLKKKVEERRAKHQSTAEQEMRLQGLTLQQLRAELSMTRRRFTRASLKERPGRAATTARTNAAVIAAAIEQRQSENAS